MASIVSEILRHLDTEAQTESLFDLAVDRVIGQARLQEKSQQFRSVPLFRTDSLLFINSVALHLFPEILTRDPKSPRSLVNLVIIID